jgi:hypothetical protein
MAGIPDGLAFAASFHRRSERIARDRVPTTLMAQTCIPQFSQAPRQTSRPRIAAEGEAMNASRRAMDRLIDAPDSTRTKLSALWVSTVFCYVYGDSFQLYVPASMRACLPGGWDLSGRPFPPCCWGRRS